MMDWHNCMYKEDSICRLGTVSVLKCGDCPYRFDDEDQEVMF